MKLLINKTKQLNSKEELLNSTKNNLYKYNFYENVNNFDTLKSCFFGIKYINSSSLLNLTEIECKKIAYDLSLLEQFLRSMTFEEFYLIFPINKRKNTKISSLYHYNDKQLIGEQLYLFLSDYDNDEIKNFLIKKNIISNKIYKKRRTFSTSNNILNLYNIKEMQRKHIVKHNICNFTIFSGGVL